MKRSYGISLVLVASLLGAMGFAVERISSDKPVCKERVCGKHTKKCSCYCSIKCGPRKIQKEDTPRFVSEDSQGQEIPAQCYCQQLDVDKYIENCQEDSGV